MILIAKHSVRIRGMPAFRGDMEYKGEGIEALVAVLDDMQGSNLILVDKKVKSLLKCLAYYEEFRTVLAYCNNGFDYQAEKRKALVKIGERSFLRLPKNPVTLVALVANMLVDFDDGTMDFVSFAGDYFPADTKQDSFDKCFASFMESFKVALVSLVVDGAPVDEKPVEREVEFAANGLQQQTEYLLVAMVNAVQESKMNEAERADYMLMLEGFAAALDSRDSLMIKSIWFGLKKALGAVKLCQKEIQRVDDMLKLYMVVK